MDKLSKPLSTNPKKWSNIPKTIRRLFASKLFEFDYFVGLALKELNRTRRCEMPINSLTEAVYIISDQLLLRLSSIVFVIFFFYCCWRYVIRNNNHFFHIL